MSSAAIASNRSAQILRPVYELFADQPDLIAQLQEKHHLPPGDRIAEESERLAVGQMVSLLKDLSQERGYADIGLSIGSSLPIGCYGSLSFLMISSATVRDMLDSYCYYYPVISQGFLQPRWSQAGNEFFLELYPPPDSESIPVVRADILLAGSINLIRHSTQGFFEPTRVAVYGDGGTYAERYIDSAHTQNIEFNSKTVRIYGAVELLDRALPGANPSLCKVFRKELDIVLRALNAEQTIIDQIQLILAKSENLGKVGLSSVAETLHLGERTLARQLAEYDISFRDLLANYKSTRAIRLLAEGKTVEEVSYYLGFSERAAFDRAFKKWQGVTAARFQDDYQHSGVREMDIMDNEQLPILPAAANQILKLINENNYEMEELGLVVEKDPALTAKLLALANSAMYGVIQIGTIKEAIVRVFGADTLRNLALAMLANECFDTSRCQPFSLKTYWINALATGQLASELAKASDCADPSDAYLLGLLHNIGTLLLVQRRPQDMAEVLQQPDLEFASLADICAAEKQVMGVDVCSSGAMLAAFWNLPRYLSVSIRVLTENNYKGESKELVHLIAAAEYTVRVLSEGGELLQQAKEKIASATGLDANTIKTVLDSFQDEFEKIEAAAEGLV